MDEFEFVYILELSSNFGAMRLRTYVFKNYDRAMKFKDSIKNTEFDAETDIIHEREDVGCSYEAIWNNGVRIAIDRYVVI